MVSAPHKGGPSAVFAHKAGKVAQDDPRTAMLRRLDYYPTPPWAGRAIGDFIRQIDPAAVSCWEPACGEGHLAHGLGEFFPVLRQSDIHLHRPGQEWRDFLAPVDPEFDDVDWVISNPPFDGAFGNAESFVRQGLTVARRGVAMLARLQFAETLGRYGLFHSSTRPVTFMVVFAERVPMHLGRYEPNGDTAMSYALFVWLQPPLNARWPDAPLWRGFPPGTRARFQRADDAAWARPLDLEIGRGVA